MRPVGLGVAGAGAWAPTAARAPSRPTVTDAHRIPLVMACLPLLGRWVFKRRMNLLHAATRGRRDGELPSSIFDHVADLRRPPEQGEDEPAHALDVVMFDGFAERLFQLVEARRAGGLHRPVGGDEDGGH